MAKKTKKSSKLVVWMAKGELPPQLLGTYRSPGPWINPDSFSLPGTDGPGVMGVIRQAYEKFGLETKREDWTCVGKVKNPANNEVNHLWVYGKLLDEIPLRGKFVGGLHAFDASFYWDMLARDPGRLSPALVSIMRAWETHAEVGNIFGPPPPCLGHVNENDVLENGAKVTTSAIIRNSKGNIWMVERSLLPSINNPGMTAFLGADGDELFNHVAQMYQRVGLISVPEDWEILPRVWNSSNHGEWKVPLLLKNPVDMMPRFSPAGHEKGKYARIGAYEIGELPGLEHHGRLSPAAKAVIEAYPALFDNIRLAA